MTKVVFSIQYAGLTLPIGKNVEGRDVTPLKPISDLFGLRWKQQHEKITNSAYLGKYLGVCTLPMWGADSQKQQKNETCILTSGDAGTQKEPDSKTKIIKSEVAESQIRGQTCILIKRVAAFLMSVNPEMVRSKGNEDGAKFLMEKQEEWADALHDYEEIGVALNLNHIKQQEQLRKARMSLVQVIGTKNKTVDAADRQTVTAVIAQMSAELGLPYQPDLLSV